MADVSLNNTCGADLLFDGACELIAQYIAADLRDGRFGVFVVHRDTREWWRLVAVFSSWERAERYANVENDCAPESHPDPKYPNRIEPDEVAAPATLPPEPPSHLAMAAAAPFHEPAKPALSPPPVSQKPDDLADLPPALVRELSRAAREVTAALEPAPPRLCAREGCGKPIAPERENYRNVRYCSWECSAIIARERAAAQFAAKVAAREKGESSATSPALPKTGKVRLWTSEEDAELARSWAIEPHAATAKRLGRSEGACTQRALKLGIKGPGLNAKRVAPDSPGSTEIPHIEGNDEEIVDLIEPPSDPEPIEPDSVPRDPALSPHEVCEMLRQEEGAEVRQEGRDSFLVDSERLNRMGLIRRLNDLRERRNLPRLLMAM